MFPEDPKEATSKRPEERPQGIVRSIAEVREERQAAKKSTYLDVSWPDPPYGISDKGYGFFKDEVEVYIQNLMNSARMIAREADLESISTIHIKEALKIFYNRPQTKRSKLFEISGGLLLGASLSFILAGDLVGKGLLFEIVTSSVAIIGALMIGMSLHKD